MSEAATPIDQVRVWRLDELRRLHFTREQRLVLLERIEANELELAEIRDLIEKRHWTAEQAFLSVC